MYVLVNVHNNTRKYFESAVSLASFLLGKKVDNYRIEVFKHIASIQEVPCCVTDISELLLKTIRNGYFA